MTNETSKSSSAGTEWTLRTWHTTTDGDRVALLYLGEGGGRRSAVLYSYAWPHAPQLIEFADRSDAVRTYVTSRESARERGDLTTIGADVFDGGE